MTYTILLRGGGRVPAVSVDKTPLQLETYIRELQGTVHFVKFVNDTDTVSLVDPAEIVGFEFVQGEDVRPVLGAKIAP